MTEVEILTIALAESVKLQACYAELLNMHDGGRRMIFKTSEEWLERLAKTGTIKPQLSQGAQQALKCPANYESLPGDAQWEIDKQLGILDWDGK